MKATTVTIVAGIAALTAIYLIKQGASATGQAINDAASAVMNGAGAVIDTAGAAVSYINPLNDSGLAANANTNAKNLFSDFWSSPELTVKTPENNIFYTGANLLTGGSSDGDPLGARIYNFFHPNE